MNALEELEEIYKKKEESLKNELESTKKVVEELTNEKNNVINELSDIKSKYESAVLESQTMKRRAELFEEMASGKIVNNGSNIMELKKKEEQGNIDPVESLSIEDFVQ